MSQITYEKAMEELQKILTLFEQNKVSIDDIPQKSSRAAELILLCKEKLRDAKVEIEKLEKI